MNGEYMPLSEGHVGMEDRSVLFGDAIYEVIAAYNGTPLLMDEHLDRWERSADGIRIPQRHSRERRIDVITELLRQFESPNAMVYGQLSRGYARRAHQFPLNPNPTEFWWVRELPKYIPAMYTDGVSVYTHPDERWARCWVKSTNLIANCMAKQFAHERGAFEAVLYREDGIITEGAAANFHVVKDGEVYTHPLDGRILGGCKRILLLEIARSLGITVREQKFTVPFLREVDEAFLTSTTINLLPVTKCDDIAVGNGMVGKVTDRLMDAMRSEIKRRCQQPASLLSGVK
ncbi:D-amino acid aminotransferase [soil metagenome]